MSLLKKLVLFFSSFEKTFQPCERIADRYIVLKHLGMGSYGHSYLVIDCLNQQKKVLKTLRLHKRLTKSGRSSFEIEKQLLLSIDHPGFPIYFESGIHKNIPFFTMEFIEGKNFEQLIFSEKIKITEEEAFKIADCLLTCIDYLHSHHIVHRDIRIPNVIFDGSNIRLIDLGLARHFKQAGVDQTIRVFNLRKVLNPQADFYGLGHFILFLLYSNFSFDVKEKEKSWEEELTITNHAKHIIKRLLQIDYAYENCSQIRNDFKKLYKH